MRAALVTAILIAALPAVAEDTLRCGSKIVRTGMTMADVKKYCGNPTSTAVEVQNVRAGRRVVGTTEIHTWIYRRSSGQRTAVLQFDQGTLKTINYQSK